MTQLDKTEEQLFDEKFITKDKWGFEVVPADISDESFIPRVKQFIAESNQRAVEAERERIIKNANDARKQYPNLSLKMFAEWLKTGKKEITTEETE